MGWLIAILWTVSLVAAIVVTWALLRRGDAVERGKLAETEAARRVAEDKALAVRAHELNQIAADLDAKLAAHRAWMSKKLEASGAEIDEEYEALARDDDALLRRLDRALGRGSDDDATGPGDRQEG